MIRAANHEKNQLRKVRYAYIAAQLFETKGSKDLALYYYNSIVELNWQAPRKFWINAKINSLRLSHEKEDTQFVQPIEELLKVYENKMFSHSLNRAIGEHYLSKKNDSLVKIYLTKSLKSMGIDNSTRKANYRDLADLNFEKGNYLETGSYLDKLLPLYEENSVAYKKLKRKRDNLSEVIIYERTLQQTDSLISLMSLSKREQLQFFEEYINKQRAIEEKNLEKQSKKKQFQFQNNVKNAFYFYNPRLVLKGQQMYKANWGDRPNVDNWRQAAVIQNALNTTKKTRDRVLKKAVFIQQTPESYLEALPQKPKTKDSIIRVNQKAYLQLGLIYKEKFEDFPLAAARLETLL